MKTIPPPCPEPEVGPKYWRSLDELSNTPEFRKWAEQEFPAGASELKDEVTRRGFMKLMSASFLLAGVGLTGCRRPVETIVPFSKNPEGYVHGVPQYFATAMPNRGSAIPLVVKSSDGRPIKIEGNSQHPDSNGGTDAFAQASLLNLYDPDRAQRFTKGGNSVTREVANDFLAETAKKFAENKGDGLYFLMEKSSSPSRARLQAETGKKLNEARWCVYEPLDFGVHQHISSLIAGPSVPSYKLAKAAVILSLDCDFIGGEEDTAKLIRGYAKGRKIENKGDKMSRLYVVEALMSQTGANADHRLRVPASEVSAVAAQIAVEVLKLTGGAGGLAAGLDKLAAGSRANPKWITECARDLAANKGGVLVLAGQTQPLHVHALAHALTAVLGGVGQTIEYLPINEPNTDKITELAKSLNDGKVDTLVILGGNPAYNAPADLDFAKSIGKAKSVIRLGYHEDETFEAAKRAADWHLPLAHYLESWGDARTSDGTVVPVQPLIEPLFGGVAEIEVLARLAGFSTAKPYDIVRETFKGFAGSDIFDEQWKKFLHDGYLEGTAYKAAASNSKAVEIAAGLLPSAAVPVPPSKSSLEVIFHRSYSMDDGRYNNNGWLQELPDPVTKLVWDNAALISRKTCLELGFKSGDVVTIDLGGRKVTAPLWIQPGQADNTLGLALGYGRTKAGRIGGFDGKSVGFNAYVLRTSTAMNFAVGAKISANGQKHKFATTQEHWAMEGRPIVREASLDQFNQKPDFARNMDLEAHSEFLPKNPDGSIKNIYPNPYKTHPHLASKMHQWGMSIDLNSCVGCSACAMACQSENNIPIVGKDQVSRGREMNWMRIDRYYTGAAATSKSREAIGGKTGASFNLDEDQYKEEWIENPQVVMQPMLCQHCENAPCESVCPVNATVHDEEGINVMAYNRCVGTRYCSNNCAWKVRRFNFFDYNKRPLENLYLGPLAHRKADEVDILKLARNPDVSVRMRGVMEKCTFCIQRIEQAKISRKVSAGASGDIEVKDGTLKTACQQACPAEAIVFGNVLDPESRVSKLKQQARNYAVLGFLETKPRTTYLAKVRNPNPAMPDYHVFSLEEYKAKSGDPFAAHGGGGGHAEPAGAAHGEKKGGH